MPARKRAIGRGRQRRTEVGEGRAASVETEECELNAIEARVSSAESDERETETERYCIICFCEERERLRSLPCACSGSLAICGGECYTQWLENMCGYHMTGRCTTCGRIFYNSYGNILRHALVYIYAVISIAAQFFFLVIGGFIYGIYILVHDILKFVFLRTILCDGGRILWAAIQIGVDYKLSLWINGTTDTFFVGTVIWQLHDIYSWLDSATNPPPITLHLVCLQALLCSFVTRGVYYEICRFSSSVLSDWLPTFFQKYYPTLILKAGSFVCSLLLLYHMFGFAISRIEKATNRLLEMFPHMQLSAIIDRER